MNRKSVAALFALLLTSLSVRADVLVLVHGYLGDAGSWDRSGVTANLVARGWQPRGALVAGPGGIHLLPAPGTSQSASGFYQVDLPSIAPVLYQASLLQAMLDSVVARHPGEKIHLVGHSAGGVVARAALVQRNREEVATLITIASPHLGTLRAVEAIEETSEWGPVGWIKDFFGGDLYHTVKDSRGLLLDLTPMAPGSLLDWLNRQPHPASVRYVSILRGGPVGMGDELVPAYSQDMARVPAIAGRTESRATPTLHSLTAADGHLIADLL